MMTSGGKDFLKSHVLWRRKLYSDWEDVTSLGRAFQVFGPATGKARLATVTIHNISKCTVKIRIFFCFITFNSPGPD